MRRGRTGEDGLLFGVALESRPLSARVAVHELADVCWIPFFASLADDWRGWTGERSCESLEGHLRLSATADSTGHVSLRVVLCGDFGRTEWSAESTLFLEAGQREGIAADACRFFEE